MIFDYLTSKKRKHDKRKTENFSGISCSEIESIKTIEIRPQQTRVKPKCKCEEIKTVVVVDRYIRVVQGIISPNIAEQKKRLKVVIVVNISPYGLIPSGQAQKRETYLQSTLSKLSIGLLLSKNKIGDALAFGNRQDLDNRAEYSLKNHTNATQEQTKRDKATHKLHSPHPFI